MTEMISTKTKTYYIGNNFFIDIVNIASTDYYEAWIYNDQYGIKDLMFGCPCKQQTYEEFLEIVSNNQNEYITYYVDDHFDYRERKKFYAENNYLQTRS